MMDFRKDEIEQPENSDDEVDTIQKPVHLITNEYDRIPTIDDVGELSHRIEEQMNLIANTLRGVDKRISANLRYISTAVMLSETLMKDQNQHETFPRDNRLKLRQVMEAQTFDGKKRRIHKKIKRMMDHVIAKLGPVLNNLDQF